MTSFSVHEKAICESKQVGSGTNILPFSHVSSSAEIGENCTINSNVFIDHNVSIGNNVMIENGVQIWSGTTIGDDVYVGPNVSFTKSTDLTLIEKSAEIGANSTLTCGITIGRHTFIHPGTVVTKDVPPHAIVEGHPATITGYSGGYEHAESAIDIAPSKTSSQKIKSLDIGGCELWSLPSFEDMRGDLMVTEFKKDLPFVPRRCFFVHNVPNNRIRGEHAHKQCAQFLVALNGGISVVIDDGVNRKEVRLDHPSVGLFMPAKVWGIQYKITTDAVLLVYASHEYYANDYIRKYSEFLNYVSQNKA